MGSHTEVRKKLKPNLWRGRMEPCHNTKTSNKVRRTTEAANNKVIICAISSPWRSRERNERKPTTGPALGTSVMGTRKWSGMFFAAAAAAAVKLARSALMKAPDEFFTRP